MARKPTRERRIVADELKPLNVPVELRCGACGRTGEYRVGRLLIDPDRLRDNDPDSLFTAFGFTSYFRCKHCGAAEPWELTKSSETLLMTLLSEAMRSPQRARIWMAKQALFDGTCVRWPAEGERHLKQLIEKDPGDYYLWSRLGNFYKIADANDQALEAFHQAITRNENDVESLHSIAQIHQARGENERAAEFFHRFLLRASKAPDRTSRDLLRNLVRHALEELYELHVESGQKIPFLPTVDPKEVQLDPAQPAVVHLYHFDLSDEKDWERMVDSWVTGAPPAHRDEPVPATPARRLSPSPPARRVSRNDPCPCGSGKKFKKCCGKK